MHNTISRIRLPGLGLVALLATSMFRNSLRRLFPWVCSAKIIGSWDEEKLREARRWLRAQDRRPYWIGVIGTILAAVIGALIAAIGSKLKVRDREAPADAQ
jgi:hypothetical protein